MTAVDLSFTLTVTMESDWQVGVGAGRHGSLDHLIDRDDDDLPYAPSSTLRGLWRDAMETLARALDQGAAGEDVRWRDVVDWILGGQPALTNDAGRMLGRAPSAGRLILDHGRLPEAMRRRLRGEAPGRRALRDGLTFVKPGVAIDARSGKAKEDHLHFEEIARAGAILTAEGALVGVPEAEARRLAAFMTAAALMIERLGGDRRRGLGRCAAALTFKDGRPPLKRSDVVILLRETKAMALGGSGSAAACVFREPETAGDLIRVTLDVTLLSPALIPADVLGNVVTSLDYIPGTYLLPHVTNALRRAGLETPEPHIAAGEVRVVPATPRVAGLRGLPTPFSWEEPKTAGGGAAFNARDRLDRTTSADGPQHKPLRSGYVAFDGAQILLLKTVDKAVRTHSVIDDEFQRPTERVGGVYTYEMLKAGWTFRSEVQVEPALLAGKVDAFVAALKGEIRLGRARSAGYGEAAVVATKNETSENPDENHGALLIWLTSDAILRDAALNSVASLPCLARAIAETFDEKAEDLFDLNAAQGALRTRRTESWLNVWRLPRPSFIALQAGSVAKLPYAAGRAPSPERLKTLQRDGVGERRAEGYGQILVNPPAIQGALSVKKWTWKRDDPAQDAATPLASHLVAFASTVERAAWRQAVLRRAEYEAADAESRKTNLGWTQKEPNMSQLGAMRAVMGRMEEEADLEAVRRWIDRLKANESRKGKWPGRSLDILSDLFSRNEEIWRVLRFIGPDSSVWGGAAIPATLHTSDEQMRLLLRPFALRALLMTAMRNHKRDMEKPR